MQNHTLRTPQGSHINCNQTRKNRIKYNKWGIEDNSIGRMKIKARNRGPYVDTYSHIECKCAHINTCVEDKSSLGRSGSTPTMTLATIWPSEGSGGGGCWVLLCMACATTGGHFIIHTRRSALMVSSWMPLPTMTAAAGADILESLLGFSAIKRRWRF